MSLVPKKMTNGTSTMVMVCIAIVIVVVSAILVLKYKYDCTIECSNTEGYTSNPLSGIDRMKRTPVTYTYEGDGIEYNPHYAADHEDRLVPLEYGGLNPYKRWVNPPVAPVRREEVQLINDSKLRLDMVESGDMEWHRTLNNMTRKSTKSIPGYYPFEIDSVIDGQYPPLYSGDFHYDAFLGQK